METSGTRHAALSYTRSLLTALAVRSLACACAARESRSPVDRSPAYIICRRRRCRRLRLRQICRLRCLRSTRAFANATPSSWASRPTRLTNSHTSLAAIIASGAAHPIRRTAARPTRISKMQATCWMDTALTTYSTGPWPRTGPSALPCAPGPTPHARSSPKAISTGRG